MDRQLSCVCLTGVLSWRYKGMFTTTYGPIRVEYKGIINRFQTIEEAFAWGDRYVQVGEVYHIDGKPYWRN